jgi:hypothetical protein
MTRLVYPNVYPTEVDGNESKDWRGSGREVVRRACHGPKAEFT